MKAYNVDAFLLSQFHHLSRSFALGGEGGDLSRGAREQEGQVEQGHIGHHRGKKTGRKDHSLYRAGLQRRYHLSIIAQRLTVAGRGLEATVGILGQKFRELVIGLRLCIACRRITDQHGGLGQSRLPEQCRAANNNTAKNANFEVVFMFISSPSALSQPRQ